jgi:hypothetical protein
MSLGYDLHDIIHGSGTQTNFNTLLLKLIFKADGTNLEKIRKGFPEAVGLVEHYRETGDIQEVVVKENTNA